MPGRNRPSFLKKQKEEQRRARATMKRNERRARKHATHTTELDPTVTEEAVEAANGDAEVEAGAEAEAEAE